MNQANLKPINLFEFLNASVHKIHQGLFVKTLGMNFFFLVTHLQVLGCITDVDNNEFWERVGRTLCLMCPNSFAESEKEEETDEPQAKRKK